MPTHCSYFLDRRRCVRRMTAGDVFKHLYTSQVVYTKKCDHIHHGSTKILHNILEGPITLGRLDRFRSTIASMIALAHADAL